MKLRKSTCRVLVFVALFISSCLQQVPQTDDLSKESWIASGMTIALYAGEGTWDESVRACQNMFLWMDHTVSLVYADDINRGDLADFSILCIPGGNMYQYAQDISAAGKEKIRTFILNGGGYLGICGGAYFASERVIWQGSPLSMVPLEIFSGTAEGPLNEIVQYPHYTMCTITLDTPFVQSEFDSACMLYYWGPALQPDTDEVDILGRYEIGGSPAVVAFDYGLGRVFLIGAHPEIEEDLDRDGVTFADELDDEGSDWDFMKMAVLWCLRADFCLTFSPSKTLINYFDVRILWI